MKTTTLVRLNLNNPRMIRVPGYSVRVRGMRGEPLVVHRAIHTKPDGTPFYCGGWRVTHEFCGVSFMGGEYGTTRADAVKIAERKWREAVRRYGAARLRKLYALELRRCLKETASVQPEDMP